MNALTHTEITHMQILKYEYTQVKKVYVLAGEVNVLHYIAVSFDAFMSVMGEKDPAAGAGANTLARDRQGF